MKKLVIVCLFFMAGCNKVVEWGKENFKQASQYDKEFVVRAKPFIKHDMVYDQLTTVADFTALFLTDAMRMLYVDYHVQKHVVLPEKEAIMRQKLLHENKYYISFYVLGSQSATSYPTNFSLFTGRYQKHESLLGEKDSQWQVALQVGASIYAPDSVRVVELPIEYQYFFGNNFSQFKSIYLVKFDALDAHDHEIFSAGTAYDVALKFTSARYKTQLTWDKVVYCEKIA